MLPLVEEFVPSQDRSKERGKTDSKEKRLRKTGWEKKGVRGSLVHKGSTHGQSTGLPAASLGSG